MKEDKFLDTFSFHFVFYRNKNLTPFLSNWMQFRSILTYFYDNLEREFFPFHLSIKSARIGFILPRWINLDQMKFFFSRFKIGAIINFNGQKRIRLKYIDLRVWIFSWYSMLYQHVLRYWLNNITMGNAS